MHVIYDYGIWWLYMIYDSSLWWLHVIVMLIYEEQSIHSLQKLNPYYFELSTIYRIFTMLLNSLRLEMS